MNLSARLCSGQKKEKTEFFGDCYDNATSTALHRRDSSSP